MKSGRPGGGVRFLLKLLVSLEVDYFAIVLKASLPFFTITT